MSDGETRSFTSICSHLDQAKLNSGKTRKGEEEEGSKMSERKAGLSKTDTRLSHRGAGEERPSRAKKVESEKNVLARLFSGKTEKRRSFTSFFSRRKGHGDGAMMKEEIPEITQTSVVMEDKRVGPSRPEPYYTHEEISSQLDHLRSKLSERSLQVDRLLRSNKDLSTRLIDKENKCKDMAKALQEKDSEMSDLSSQLKEKGTLVKEVNDAKDELEKNMNSMRDKIAGLQINSDETTKLKKDLDDTKKNYESMLDQCEKAEVDLAFLIEEKEELEKNLSQLNDDYIFLQGIHEKAASENVRYKKKFINLKRQAAEAIDKFIKENSGLIEENRFLLQKHFKNYPKEFRKMLRVTDDCMQLEKERNCLVQQIEYLTTKMVTQEVLISDLETELTSAVQLLTKNGIEWTVHKEQMESNDASNNNNDDSSSGETTSQSADDTIKNQASKLQAEGKRLPTRTTSRYLFSSEKNSKTSAQMSHPSDCKDEGVYKRYNYRSKSSKRLYSAKEYDEG